MMKMDNDVDGGGDDGGDMDADDPLLLMVMIWRSGLDRLGRVYHQFILTFSLTT